MTSPFQQDPKSRFAAIYDATADSMRAELAAAQAGLTHSGARGASAEDIFVKFLKGSLPAMLGVTRGQVVDSHGNFSGQCDTIIYNLARTPMLFSGDQDGDQTVPVEGVVAVIEVKSVLQKKDLPQLVEHARKLKSLDRRAYLPQPNSRTYRAYDQNWRQVPPVYAVFAFNSDGLYIEELNELHKDLPLHMRVDNMCALDRGLAINVCVTGNIDDPSNLITFSATATKASGLGEVVTEQPLVAWFAVNSTHFAQADCPPINLGIYVEDRLRLSATMPPGTAEEIRSELYEQVAAKLGVDTNLLKKIDGSSKEPPTGQDILALVGPYSRGEFQPEVPRLSQLLAVLAELPDEERPAVLAAYMAQ